MIGRPRLPRPRAECHPDRDAYNSNGVLCKTCYKREWARAKRKANPPLSREYKPVMAKCHPDKRHWGKGLCIACYMRDYRKNNPDVNKRATAKWRAGNADKIYEKHLRYRYGLSLHQFKQLVDEQHGLCKLCEKPLTNKTAIVEHNHTTEKIRGIVHQRCNQIIAWFENSLPYKMQIERYLSGSK